MGASAVFIVLSGSVTFADIDGADITLKNKGGDAVFNHENHVKGAGLKCQDCHAKLYTNTK